MRTLLHFLYEKVTLPQPWNPAGVNPALMTYEEYYDIANPRDREHDEGSYDYDVGDLNAYLADKSEYTDLLGQKTIKGLRFEIRLRREKLTYSVRNPDAERGFDPFLRTTDGDIKRHSDGDIQANGWKTHDFTIAIFNEDGQVVARAQDEWGAMLIMVAKEYRGFGLGPLLGQYARTYEPAKDSGGFTPGGARNFRKVYREFVRKALTSGLYLRLVKSGDITADRVREIIRSAQIDQRPTKKDDVDLSSSDPKDFLLYGDHGQFVVYNRKLKDLVGNERYAHFADAMIKATVMVSIDRGDISRIKMLGGDKPALKTLMLRLAIAYAARSGTRLFIEPDEVSFLPAGVKIGEVTKEAGYDSHEVIEAGDILNYAGMVNGEKLWRRSFDRHDEFLSVMVESAESKFRQY